MLAVDVPKVLPKNKLESIGISRQTNQSHLKLWQGYAEKFNKTVGDLDTRDLESANAIYSDIRHQKMAQIFAYGGYLNHKVFFNHLNGNGVPTKEFKALIKDPYGSFDNWLNDFKATALCARGWAFCCYDFESETVQNVIGDSQDTYPIWNAQLLCGIDVYEHAWFFDFEGDREKYLDAILSVFDYDQIVRNLKR